MGRYHHRRPLPISIAPNHVQRADPGENAEPTAKEEPESPETPGSNSFSTAGASSVEAESPSPTQTIFLGGEAEDGEPPSPKETKAPEQLSPSASAAAVTSQDSETISTSPPSPSLASAPGQLFSSLSGVSEATSAAQSSSSPVTATPEPPSPSSTSIFIIQTKGPSTATLLPSITTSVISGSQFSSKNAAPSVEPTSPVIPSSASTGLTPAQSELAGEDSGIRTDPPRKEAKHGPTMSKGAEAALISCAVLGFLALIIGATIFFKRQRRKRHALTLRHASHAFDPSNTGSLHAPETVHIGSASGAFSPHFTQQSSTSNNSTSLFGPAPYHRPETVVSSSSSKPSTSSTAPLPTPNPFADPPLTKAYDRLRGRPVSTTLTNRDSWIRNPFKDPASERFDPFGELQEKAQRERVRYVKEVRREEEAKKRLMEEGGIVVGVQEGFGRREDKGRKGSGVTVEGLGVLDRSEAGVFR